MGNICTNLNETWYILIQISLNFVHKCPMNDILFSLNLDSTFYQFYDTKTKKAMAVCVNDFMHL